MTNASDRTRKYAGNRSAGDPFNIAELNEYVIEPLDAVVNMPDFLELANWCASEDERLLKALYLACRNRGYTGYIEYLEQAYGCGNH